MICKEPRTDKKKPITCSLDMWMQCLSHENQGVKTIEIELIPYPMTAMPFMIQSVLTNHQDPKNTPLEVVSKLFQTQIKPTPNEDLPNSNDNNTSNDDWSGCSDGGYSNGSEIDANGDLSGDDVNSDDGRGDHAFMLAVLLLLVMVMVK